MNMPPLRQEAEKPKAPKNLKEYPAYLKELFTGFFSRLFYIYGLVWETRPWMLFVMLFMSVFNGVMPLLGAYISRNLINALIDAQNHDFRTILNLLIFQFAYLFLLRLVTSVDSMLTRTFGELVVQKIRQKIMHKSNELDLQSFDQPEFYTKLENANREAGHRPLQIATATFSMMSTLISMVSFIVVLWAVSPVAPLAIILAAIPSAIVNYIYKGKNAAYMRHRSTDRRKMDYYSGLMVDKDQVKEVRLFRLGPLFMERFNQVFEKYFAGMKALIYSEGKWNIAATGLMSLVTCGIFIWVARKVFAGELTVGDYTLYTGALNSIGSGVSSLITTTASIYEGTLFIDNMIAFMNEKKTITPRVDPPVPVRRGEHEIEYRHVYFRYPGMDHDVLKDINLHFRSGESVVLVGLNGAGKTTLLKLMTRLYDPTAGVILLDGRDIRDYDVEQLYDIFGTIFQDFGRYADTAEMNIAYGQIDKPLDPEKVREAAVQGNAAPYIEKLAKGYQTPLMRIFEQDGAELSVGQWQKLAVSRAFYNDSDILILDEPTASLDPIAEQEIFSQFDRLREGKLTFYVSHRLSSATTATQIVVLENGTVAEVGTHAELIVKDGTYHKLFTVQAERYRTGTEQAPAA